MQIKKLLLTEKASHRKLPNKGSWKKRQIAKKKHYEMYCKWAMMLFTMHRILPESRNVGLRHSIYDVTE